ncbi:hypothetical protein [Leucobacter sp. cx-169]|uniref:hypothetical protein n=1 Tax=Leucobacter sp. cx-169 TaxID=2770549 RepID=UPI00165E410E|nr:hypothetical protein [Leucobacter sp. cx-169]MBC9927260.1 hypothetical protein [Leucobacter sp. cx-169]
MTLSEFLDTYPRLLLAVFGVAALIVAVVTLINWAIGRNEARKRDAFVSALKQHITSLEISPDGMTFKIVTNGEVPALPPRWEKQQAITVESSMEQVFTAKVSGVKGIAAVHPHSIWESYHSACQWIQIPIETNKTYAVPSVRAGHIRRAIYTSSARGILTPVAMAKHLVDESDVKVRNAGYCLTVWVQFRGEDILHETRMMPK